MDKESFSQPDNERHHQILPKELSQHFRIERQVDSNDIFTRYRAYDLKEYRPVTLTILQKISKVYKIKIAKALKRLVSVNHQNILPIFEHGTIDKNKRYYWSTPYVNVVNWKDEVQKYKSKSEVLDFLINLILDLLTGLNVAHKHQVVHGEICLNNIVKFKDHFCISDFALPISRIPIDKKKDLKLRSTVFTAPEIMNGEKPDFRTDFYGLGITLKEILKFCDNKYFSLKDKFFLDLKKFIDQLTEKNRKKRFISIEKAIVAFKQILEYEQDYKKRKIQIKKEEDRRNELITFQNENISKLMPVLGKTASKMDKNTFKDIVVLHINHGFEDIILLNQILYSLGVTIIFVIIPYSNITISQPLPYRTYHASYSQNGFKLYRDGEKFGQTTFDFNAAVHMLISTALQNDILNFIKKGKKFLIIEDGGYHYDILFELYSKKNILKHSIIGVIEQTTSGTKRCANFLKINEALYPVLTIARSNVKMRFEPYFIARRIVDEINYLLYIVNNFLPYHNVIIIGYGIIGRSIATALNGMNCKISIIDIDNKVSNLAKKEGYCTLKEIPKEFFERTTIMIGASGESSFTYPMLISFLESNSSLLYLASASSKRIEFANLIDFFEGSYEKRGKIIQLYPHLNKIDNIEIEFNKIGLTYHFKYNGKNKQIILIARGFPVNFYRPGIISLTYSIIDLINTEILLLSQHLVYYFPKLEKKLYLLGGSTIPYLEIYEENLVSTWIKVNKLSEFQTSKHIWDNFQIHPLENRLRRKCLGVE